MCIGIILPQSLFSAIAVGDENSENPVYGEIRMLIHEADSLAKAYQLDTAVVLGNLALEKARKEFGASDTTVASAMSVLGKCSLQQAHYAQCESLWNKSLAIRKEILNPDDLRIASSLNDLGILYRRQGKYAEAEPAFTRALSIREKSLGPEHPVVAGTMNNLAGLYADEGKYSEAEPLYRRALAIREKALGPDHLDVAESLNSLATLFRVQSKYIEAETFNKRALDIREKILGPEHPDVAASLNGLAWLYQELGRYSEAEPLHKRALAIREKTQGPEHPDVAANLGNLASFYVLQGKYSEAEPLHKRAISIKEKTLGMEHPSVAGSLSNLANLYISQNRFVEAEPLYKRALTIQVNTEGEENHWTALTMNNMAVLYWKQGKYREAEPLLNRALEIWEKVMGPEHPAVALSLNNLALIYKDQGKYADAEAFHKRALAIREKGLGPEHPYVASSLENLAEVYRVQGRYDEAEPLFERALAMKEKLQGSEHPDVAEGLSNHLANLYRDQGRYSEAESLYERALVLWEKALGPENFDMAATLDDLAELYRLQGEYTHAEPLFKQALAIRERVLGPEHPVVAENLKQLARTYSALKEFPQATEHYRKLQTSKETFLEYVFSYASEEQKMRYLEKYPLIDCSLLSFAILHPSAESKHAALDMILRGKAAVIHAVAAEHEIAFCSYDEEIRAKSERHAEVCGEIATLALAGTEDLEPEIYRTRLETLYSTKDSLETELSTICSEFEEEMASRRFGIDDIAAALPPGAVLWEFVRYEPYDFNKVGSEKERTGPSRYLVFTLDHSGTIDLIDLGDAGEIDSLVALARNRIYKARGDVFSPSLVESERSLAQVTGEIYERIFAPLETSIRERDYIFISPDGELNLLPFEILPCPDGQFVVERFNMSYLSSGRDLLSFEKLHEPSDWALLIADPDFDLSGEALPRHREDAVANQEFVSLLFEPSRGTSECLESTFDPLPYSQKEIESVGRTLRKKDRLRVASYEGGDALEEVVKGIETPPRVLHLATHGYFCGDVTEANMLENPLLRSGLALAGANRSRERGTEETSQGEDGILTAFEVSGLNLVGTELATLSACETGVGEVRNGEGVYGLRRAFQHAGAQAILMSLWKMPDREIYGLMDSFYRNWSEGHTKQEALRQSTLKMIHDLRNKYSTAHPLLWGGFVLAGNPN
jgi:tetratricopeptide (TPR) repeat protein/CHAT domain-containing protein